jgi:hypothetical protein
MTSHPPILNPNHRTIPEPKILEMLLLYGWAFDLAAGRRAAAMQQCQAALETLIRNGLGFRAAARHRLFDPVEVLNTITAEGHAGRLPIWTGHFIPTARAHVQEHAERRQQKFHMRYSRTLTIPKTQDRLRLTMPVPIVSSYLHDLTITVAKPPGQMTLRDTCIDIRLPPPQDTLTIAAEFAFTAIPQPRQAETLPETERQLYLRPAENLIRVTPRIAALAAALAGDSPTPHAKLAKFWNFMLDHLMLGMIRYSDIPPHEPGDWVLDNGWFDCLLGSCLLISLCRAQGIPARLLGGHLLYRRFPATHYWTECWIDGPGWLPFDLLAWELSEAGRDPAWRDVFAGACDSRMAMEIFPLRFTGPMSLRLPPEWHLLQSQAGNGVTCSYTHALDGSPIYRDQIEHISTKTTLLF